MVEAFEIWTKKELPEIKLKEFVGHTPIQVAAVRSLITTVILFAVLMGGKLLGRIREKGFTQEQLANLVGMTPGTMSTKLNNQSHFNQSEILAISEVLDISISEYGEYFFTRKVRKNTN